MPVAIVWARRFIRWDLTVADISLNIFILSLNRHWLELGVKLFENRLSELSFSLVVLTQ